jgi:hypothetical protein
MTNIRRIEDKIENMAGKLAIELERARLENRRLRARIEPKHGYHRNTRPRILREARDTALRILIAHAAGEPISRAYFQTAGISRTKRYWGIGLLRAAKIMDRTNMQFVVEDFVTAEKRLLSKFSELSTAPDALERLRLYMPKDMAYMYKGISN